MSTCPPAQDQVNFVRTSTFFSIYLDIYNKFKNLIRTCKFKFSFIGLKIPYFYWSPKYFYLSVNVLCVFCQ
jgi:hypothetical protein